MEYKKYKDADKTVSSSKYVVNEPKKYQRKWSDLFGNKNPICIEIGMGRGDFIIDMALSYPNKNFIGIEVNDSQMVMAVNRLEKIELNNLKLINIDAKELGDVFLKEIDTIYLTFCDPWPVKKLERKRLTHESFLRIYDKLFKKDKHIILKSDNKGFFAYSLESMSQYWYTFNKISLDLHNEEVKIENIMTNYEKQYYKEGRPVCYVDATYKN